MTGEPLNVDDFEEAARARLDPGAYGYFVALELCLWTLYFAFAEFRDARPQLATLLWLPVPKGKQPLGASLGRARS